MNATLKWLISTVLMPLILGYGGAFMGAHTRVSVLEERIASVKEFAAGGISEAKAMAVSAHERIDFFSRGGG